ncbi:MAG: non-homologous end-joining DNA ligase [Acidimicrobiales bacterium]
MNREGDKVSVTVGGKALALSNLQKTLFPSGFTKGDVLDYYARIAPVMLRHLQGRPVTVKRFPNGTHASGFVEKNVPRHAPEWIRTVTLPRKGTGWGSAKQSDRDTTQYTIVDDLATLTWLANLASIEFHTPMWRVGPDNLPEAPDLVVFDLDPGEPATITECCDVALRLQARVAKDRIDLIAKTSGSKGLQCYGRITSLGWPSERSNEYAHEIAAELELAQPDLIVSKMAKALRPGKVLIDWSQNNTAKTTVTPYSLRALDRPTVSTPVTWDEVEQGAAGRLDLLGHSPADVLQRVELSGDLFGPLLG